MNRLGRPQRARPCAGALDPLCHLTLTRHAALATVVGPGAGRVPTLGAPGVPEPSQASVSLRRGEHSGFRELAGAGAWGNGPARRAGAEWAQNSGRMAPSPGFCLLAPGNEVILDPSPRASSCPVNDPKVITSGLWDHTRQGSEHQESAALQAGTSASPVPSASTTLPVQGKPLTGQRRSEALSTSSLSA